MTTFPGSPKVLKGGLVLIDADTGQVLRIISLQYNPDSLTRTLQVQAAGGGGRRPRRSRCASRARRSRPSSSKPRSTPPTSWSFPTRTATAGAVRHPAAARGAGIAGPSDRGAAAARSTARRARARWRSRRCWRRSRSSSGARAASCRCASPTSRITEEAFDPALNPIRAKVSLGLRVLSIDDLGFSSKGGSLFMTYLQTKEQLAAKAQPAASRRSASEGSADGPGTSLPAGERARARRLFPPTSRYYGIADGAADAARRPHRRLRAAPLRAAAGELRACCSEHVVAAGDRLDNLAARYLGDPEQSLAALRCQRRHAARGAELADTVGATLRDHAARRRAGSERCWLRASSSRC